MIYDDDVVHLTATISIQKSSYSIMSTRENHDQIRENCLVLKEGIPLQSVVCSMLNTQASNSPVMSYSHIQAPSTFRFIC